MTTKTQSISITKEPAFVSEEKIWKSTLAYSPVITPTKEIIMKLEPEEKEFFEPYKAPYDPSRDLLINIETTGLYPFNSKIISIAFQDLTLENSVPIILVGDDEQALIEEFLSLIDKGNWNRLVGWNLSFDYRFIFTIAALYRRPSPKFYNLELRDVQQIYQQVKEAFVYGFQKPNKLDEWATFLLGRGKFSDQKEVLKRYLAGDFEFIRAFQVRQIEITRDLYHLARYISSASPKRANEPSLELVTSQFQSPEQKQAIETGNTICPECKSFNPIGTKICSICKIELK